MLRPIKNWFIYVTVRAACALIGHTPARWMQTLSCGIGALAYTFAGYERNCARNQLHAAFGRRLSSTRSLQLTRGVFNRLAWNAVELLRMSQNPNFRPRVQISDESRRVLDDALAQSKGVVFVTGHLGNWELMAAALVRLGYPIYTIAKKSYDSRFTQMIHRARTGFGVRVIFRGDRGAAAAMLRALKNNGILGFLIDQDTNVPSVYAPFFGRLAKTPTGPAVFAKRTGAPMVTGAISREIKDGSHRIEIAPFAPKEQIDETIAALNFFLEERIRRHPCEWVWFHRRWKSTVQEKKAA